MNKYEILGGEVEHENDNTNQNTFIDEETIKTWRLTDPDNHHNFNLLSLTSHRIILESSRAHRQFVHSSLNNEYFNNWKFFYKFCGIVDDDCAWSVKIGNIWS